MVIIHRPGRAHSNVDPLSRLPRMPTFISPARKDLPEPSLSTEHEELQQAWQSFIKERECAVEVKTVVPTDQLSSRIESQTEDSWTPRLHVFAEKEAVQRFSAGYAADKDFKTLVSRSRNEGFDEKKYRAYRLGANGLLYFEDADSRIRLCVPKEERKELLKEVHDGPHESAHAGWERTLAGLRERFYWPSMRTDVIQYVRTCDPCQKIKHSRGA